jgi:hypothetical protein
VIALDTKLAGSPDSRGASVNEEHHILKPQFTIAFVYDEPEFIAASRAVRFAQGKRDHLAHLFVLCMFALFLLYMPAPSRAKAAGKVVSNGPSPWMVAAFQVYFAAHCGYYLHNFVLFPRRRFHRLYRKFPLAGEKILYTLTSSRLAIQHKLAQSSTDWSLVRKVTELRDGFVIQLDSGLNWIPRHAVGADFGDVPLAEFLRQRVKYYRVIDRTAGLPTKGKERALAGVEV